MIKEDILKILEEANNTSSNLTDKQYQQYVSEAHKKQNKERASKGGKTMTDARLEHLKDITEKFGKKNGKRNVESGLLKSIASIGGKAGAKSQIKNAVGIHTTDEIKRKEWARLGGLAVIDKLNEYKICPHCKIKTRGAAYNRWHGDNCKHKK